MLATYDRIKNSYFWRNMLKQIRIEVKRCLVCQRNDRINPINHPAQAIEVDSIFDKVGIDLSFGFPETSEGFKGIMVCIEYLSNFTFIFAIKSKTKEEISTNLIKYIVSFHRPSRF